MQSQGMNGIATPKRSMRRPQCAELDDLYVPVRHGQLIIVRTESAIRALCLSMTFRRGHPPWRWPTRREVTAAVLTKMMLTILSLAAGTVPPWPCSR